jgi:5-methylcytosine-specific restriction endonuclease McrA
MCDGNYKKEPEFAANHRKIRYDRRKASYFMRGRYRKIGGKNCVYCGFKADTGDHVPSLFAGYTNGVSKGVIVSSCYDCNKYLGPFSSTCLRERAAFLASIYDE